MAITWCGKRMWKSIRAIPTSTLGYEKMFNWAFRCNEESDFISTLLTGQPEPPKYFSLMKNLNKYGPPIRKKRILLLYSRRTSRNFEERLSNS